LTKDGANTGNAALNPLSEPFSMLSSVALIRAREDQTTNEYLLHYFLSPRGQYQIKGAMAGQAITRIMLTTIGAFSIPLPPLPEQRKITEILATWDRAIDLTERIIATKQRRKRALMQRLLTGKVRFPGFTEPWEEVRLDQVSEVLFSNVDKLTHEDEVAVRLCNYLDVYYNNYLVDDLDYMEATANEREIERFSLLPDDVLITKDSEVADDIAVSAVVTEALSNVICGYHLAVIRPMPESVDGPFLSMLFKLHKVRYYFSTLANGITRFGLTQPSVNHAHFLIPSVTEQRKVAEVLSAADREIEALKHLRVQQQEQKKGLMQQLLTGKTRVKV